MKLNLGTTMAAKIARLEIILGGILCALALALVVGFDFSADALRPEFFLGIIALLSGGLLSISEAFTRPKPEEIGEMILNAIQLEPSEAGKLWSTPKDSAPSQAYKNAAAAIIEEQESRLAQTGFFPMKPEEPVELDNRQVVNWP